MQIDTMIERFALRRVFTVSRGAKHEAVVITVRLSKGGAVGHGECVPYARYGESLETVQSQINSLPRGFAPEDLTTLLPPGAARNAIDCAMWDLRAKLTGRAAHGLGGLPAPKPVQTAMTLSLDHPKAMAKAAAEHADYPTLKIKLGAGAADIDRLRVVHQAAPRAKLIVDANEGWSVAEYEQLLPHLEACNVALIEQPLPAGQDAALRDLPRPIPVCADESCHVAADIPRLLGLYDMVNIKLDKTGGLTAALVLRDAARDAGLGVMVGCMVGSSLSMAPALLVAQGADVVDLDGALLLAHDRDYAMRYEGALLYPAPKALWG